jgi:tetratricopeptide (TPR) repeat protein
MPRICSIFTFALFLILSPLYADQNDPRLDGLFEELQSTPDPELAHTLEQRIWIVWLRSGDEDIDTLMEQGIAAMGRRNYDAALATFDRIVDRAPDFAEGWNKRATVHYLRGDYAASMRDVQRTLALEPRHFGALSGMGLIFLATGDDAAALRAFEEVLQVHPLSLGTRARVEQLRRQLRDEVI